MCTSELDPKIRDVAAFYSQHYDWIEPVILHPGMTKIILGCAGHRTCRFCGCREPEVTFRHEAHAIPEALGNRSIFTYYECDSCNTFFGQGIENDLGNWTKPSRTISRIKGKRGVPTLKGGSKLEWRLEYTPSGFRFQDYESNPKFCVDVRNKRIKLELERDVYTPVAVLKALVRIGLTLIPSHETHAFSEALAWIRDPDHSRVLVTKWPVFWTYRPGPMPNDLITVILMRRKPSVEDVPYAFMVLIYGNDMFQVFLPAPRREHTINQRDLTFPSLPTPSGSDLERYGPATVKQLDMCGREVVRGETVPVSLGFDYAFEHAAN